MAARPRNAKAVWSAELASEVGFWDEWLATKGLEWPEEYRARLDANRPLQPHIVELLLQCQSDPIQILDVGAGPITNIGYRWEGRNVRIVAVDPLADRYDRLLEKHGVTPPVRTTWCHGEALTDRFPPETFDLVHAQNSLDHSYDPVTVVEEVLRVTKTGGTVWLNHAANEAEREAYQGLHQWNFCERAGDFVIWSKSDSTNVSERVARFAETRCWVGNGGVGVEMKKIATTAVGILDRFPRVQAKLVALGNRLFPARQS